VTHCGRICWSYPCFSISSKPSQVSSNLYRQLAPLFQSFFNSVLQTWGQNPSCGRKFLRQNFHFLIRYSNVNILSFWYWNQAIQKSKFIYTCRTTTFMRIRGEIKSFYRTESGRNLVGKKWSPNLIQKLTNAEHPDMTESIT